MTDNETGNAKTFNFDCKVFNRKEVIGKLLMSTNISQRPFVVLNRVQFISELSFIMPSETIYVSFEFGTRHTKNMGEKLKDLLFTWVFIPRASIRLNDTNTPSFNCVEWLFLYKRLSCIILCFCFICCKFDLILMSKKLLALEFY